MTTDERLCKGTLGDANATLYTTPAATKTIVKSLSLCNTSASPVTVALKLAGTDLYSAYPLAANTSVSIQCLDQIVEATELIEGSASMAAVVTYYISGKEVT